MTAEEILKDSDKESVEVTIKDIEEDSVDESEEEMQRIVLSVESEVWMKLCIVEERLECVGC